MILKVYKNNQMIKQLQIQDIKAWNDNIRIDEEYNPQANYYILIEYQTLLGESIEITNTLPL